MHPPAGLCPQCAHCKTIRSDKGSEFLQCLRSFTDPRYAKYPRLPVRICPGFQQTAAAEDSKECV